MRFSSLTSAPLSYDESSNAADDDRRTSAAAPSFCCRRLVTRAIKRRGVFRECERRSGPVFVVDVSRSSSLSGTLNSLVDAFELRPEGGRRRKVDEPRLSRIRDDSMRISKSLADAISTPVSLLTHLYDHFISTISTMPST
jgi:hypothetical protein